MRKFNVHFSFYSEEYGNFDDNYYSVTAETPFEARDKAWAICDQDSDTLLHSNIKQYGVTWSPNLLDAGDYFYSHAANIKQGMGHLLNVDIPNDEIANMGKQHRLESERCSYLIALQTLNDVAKDLYADKGILPPSVYEELHYTELLCEQLGWGEKTDALWERIEKVRKWDHGAIYAIQKLFRDGYTWLCSETTNFKEHFGRNGIYPVHNNLDEYDRSYVARWKNKWKVDSLKRLPLFQETDVIKNSAGHMDYEWQTLLLDSQTLKDGYRIPENQLWQPSESLEHGTEMENGMLLVENLITGQRMSCHESNFLGVIRPDKIAVLDFEALKKEYIFAHYGDVASERGVNNNAVGTENDDNEFER